jgi:putative oxidoreductase
MLRKLYPPMASPRTSTGLLLLRLVTGLAFVFHGLGKIQSPGGMMHWMGADAPVPSIFQCAAAASEFGGGLLLMAGLFTPIAAVLIAIVMVTALGTVHLPAGDRFVNPAGRSYELAATYLAQMILFLLAGPGVYSADSVLLNRR